MALWLFVTVDPVPGMVPELSGGSKKFRSSVTDHEVSAIIHSDSQFDVEREYLEFSCLMMYGTLWRVCTRETVVHEGEQPREQGCHHQVPHW